MKRFIALVALATILLTGQRTQADFVIAGWTFETSLPTTAGPHAAEVGSGEASGFHSSLTTTYSNPQGNGSAESFSSNNWSSGDYYQFDFSSTGQTGISISFDQTRSSTGPATFILQYSVDDVNYVGFGNEYTVTTAWVTNSFDFGGLLDNVASASIRLTSQVNAAGTGTNRVDNVFIRAVPEPSAMVLLGMCLVPLALGRRRSSTTV